MPVVGAFSRDECLATLSATHRHFPTRSRNQPMRLTIADCDSGSGTPQAEHLSGIGSHQLALIFTRPEEAPCKI